MEDKLGSKDLNGRRPQQIFNGRQPKKLKWKTTSNKLKWKTTSNKFKWKTTWKAILIFRKMEDHLNFLADGRQTRFIL